FVRFYCDYCDTYLTHDSPSVRKTHCSGRKHKENVKDYYQKWMEEQAQSLIDKTSEQVIVTAAFQQGKIPPTPFPGGPPPGGPPRPGMLPTPPMGGPPMMPMMGPPPHGMMPGGPGKKRVFLIKASLIPNLCNVTLKNTLTGCVWQSKIIQTRPLKNKQRLRCHLVSDKFAAI
ncbi:U1 small nuclear ribonucleoprotein C, partial [Nibea albiflora]